MGDKNLSKKELLKFFPTKQHAAVISFTTTSKTIIIWLTFDFLSYSCSDIIQSLTAGYGIWKIMIKAVEGEKAK